MACPVQGKTFNIVSMATTSTALDADSLSRIRKFIRQRNTAVLTTMFTDIEGFTEVTERRGDIYSVKLRQAHDALLSGIIESDGQGLVIKFIGDAVMAIFSEPSIAVQRAIDIQLAIDKFNRDQPDFEDLAIRIGLHMGQVAIEDGVQVDVFGRHVNRAARIESLAAGGQVYMSYPVFDSARGWVQENEALGWQYHGDFDLKGIDHLIGIYEVTHEDLAAASPPVKHKAVGKSSPQKWMMMAGCPALVAVALVLLLFNDQLSFRLNNPANDDETPKVVDLVKARVTLVNVAAQGLTLNPYKKLILEGAGSNGSRRILTPLDIGPHVLYYDTSNRSRHYAKINVSIGENFISPVFQKTSLPGLRLRVEKPSSPVSKSLTASYVIYNAASEPRNYELDFKNIWI